MIVGMRVLAWNTELLLSVLFAVATKRPPETVGENATLCGDAPVENVPVTGVNTPVEVLTVYIEIEALVAFDTAANKFPATSGENATAVGLLPVAKGDPATAVKKPVDVFTEYTDTEFAVLSFDTATNKFPFMFGEKATDRGPFPVVKGELGTCVKTPVVVLTE